MNDSLAPSLNSAPSAHAAAAPTSEAHFELGLRIYWEDTDTCVVEAWTS